ncbi:hypothetical protein [Streptomyces sp. NPDC006739]|uniref:hypothetical protein n=1 Tax=Streptomyces sp. NPDC006739 TaxID=3364763 RepID=UPI00369DFD23
MRRTTLHRTSVTALAAAALLLTGCGSQSQDAKTGSGSVSPSPASSSPSSPSATAPTAPSGTCAPQTQLTAADSGRTVCLGPGSTLRITLDGTKERPWKQISADGGALKAANPGFVIQPGDATAAFTAAAPGTVHLTSSRPMCAQPTGPGQVSCKGIQEWTVTVTVHAG